MVAFSMLSHIFNKYGAETKLLDDAPTAENLKGASVYFLIDPDWPKKIKHKLHWAKHIDALLLC